MNVRFLAALSLFGLLTGAAEPLVEWQFRDEIGTPTSQLVNSGRYSGVWDGDFEATVTDGTGSLLISRTPQSTANIFVPLTVPAGESLPDTLWVLVEIAGWNFRGTVANETMRLGLSHTRHDQRPRVVAQIRMGRVAEDQVIVAAEGFGEGAEDVRDLPLFRAAHDTPLQLALKVNRIENTFELHLRQDEGVVMFLGGGAISPERSISFLRLGFAGHFAARNEYLRLNRIALLSENPFE